MDKKVPLYDILCYNILSSVGGKIRYIAAQCDGNYQIEIQGKDSLVK